MRGRRDEDWACWSEEWIGKVVSKSSESVRVQVRWASSFWLLLGFQWRSCWAGWLVRWLAGSLAGWFAGWLRVHQRSAVGRGWACGVEGPG